MKTKKTKIDISSKWENQLPLYLDLYSKLNDEGKKEIYRIHNKHYHTLLDRIAKDLDISIY